MTDPTKREVLTGDELETAYWTGKGSFRVNLRAVEQAVVAKLLDNNFSPYVSPAEARERERKAWDAGAEWANMKWSTAGVPGFYAYVADERDRRYPSLDTPPKPKGVTLSDGKVWRRTDDGWRHPGYRRAFDAPLCLTPEDFEAVARYLRDREAK